MARLSAATSTRIDCLGKIGSGGLLEVKLAALPENTPQHYAPSCSQTYVIVADNQHHPMQTVILEALQEGSPVALMLAQRHGKTPKTSFPLGYF